MNIDTLRAGWPHLRTVLIFLHVLAVIALSLPTPGGVSDRAQWKAPNMQEDLEQWAERLGFLGYESKEELEEDLWNLAQSYLATRRAVIAPFERYARYTGAIQGWRMFANPRVHIAELHIDIMEGGAWRPVYRPHSERYDFWGDTFRHNRVRKLLGRIGRPNYRGELRELSEFLAREVARAHAEASHVRVRLYRYRSLEPAQVRAGEKPQGTYDKGYTFSTQELE